MLYKRCSRCGARLQVGCRCSCAQHRYKKLKDENNISFYNTSEWKKLRKRVKKHYFGLDFYAFYVHGKVEFGYTAHHIVPIEKDDSLKLDFENLIYVSESSHREIHSLLESDYSGTVALLQNVRAAFERDFYRG